MRTSFVTVFGLVGSALAIPATFVQERQVGLCSTGSPLCCDVDVLGVADLNCETAPEIPTDLANFEEVCASVGKIDMCCILPILEQGILCQTPS